MRTVAIVDEFRQSNQISSEKIAQIKEMAQADYAVAVMSGNYLQSGLPALESKHDRAKAAMEAGVDVVIERPVYTSLTSLDTYVPSGIALLEKTNSIDVLSIPVAIEDRELVEKITLFLFAETREFQNKIKSYIRRGESFYDAQAKVIAEKFPGLEEELKKPVNYVAFEYTKALKRMYSQMKPMYLGADYFSEAEADAGASYEQANRFFPMIKYEMILLKDRLSEIYGGSTTLTNQLLEVLEGYTDYASLVKDCVTADHPKENLNHFLFHVLLGIGKQDIAMSRMYDSAAYARVLAFNPDAQPLLDKMNQKSRIPLIFDPKEDYEKLERTGRGLFDIDVRASKIYKML